MNKTIVCVDETKNAVVEGEGMMKIVGANPLIKRNIDVETDLKVKKEEMTDVEMTGVGKEKEGIETIVANAKETKIEIVVDEIDAKMI